MMYPGALRRILLAGALALLALAPGVLVSDEAKAGGPIAAPDSFEIDQFYDELAPFGEWVSHPSHGYVWLPRTVAPDWRPYTVGNWVSTEEYGWYWDSPEPFAWAVYHYGRWGFEPDYGWYWVPGDTWAPAWVQWRYGDEYVGWAPEAPAPYGEYAYGGPARYAPPPPRESWVFVEPRYLVSPAVRSYAVPRTSISIAFSRSTYIYRPEYRNGYVYNRGMPRDRWSRITRRHLEPRKIHRGHQRARPNNWNKRNARDLYVYAPGVKKGARPRKPPNKIAHKPTRAQAKAKNAKAGAAQRGRAPRPDVANPHYRGSGARGQTPRAHYGAPGRRKPPLVKSTTNSRGAKAKKGKYDSANRGPGARAHHPQGERKSANKPSQAKPTRANADKDKSKSAKPRPDRPNTAKAGADQRKRAMGLAPPTSRTRPGTMSPNDRGSKARSHNRTGSSKAHGKRKPPDLRRSPPKSKATKSEGQQQPKSKASKSEGHKPKAKTGSANTHKSAKHKASKPNAAKSANAQAKKSRSARARPKSATSRPAHARPKSAKARSGHKGGKGSRKRNASGNGGGGGKGCKANPNRRSCGGRG